MSNRQTLWIKLSDPEYRNAFVSSNVAARIAVRIHNLRHKLGWTQTKLAEQTGMKQARISVLEQADYENFSFNTLKRIAAAFNVAVIIDFVSFPDFLKWNGGIDSESVAPQSFDESQKAQTAHWVADAIIGSPVFQTNEVALRHFLESAFHIGEGRGNRLELPTNTAPTNGATLIGMHAQ
jgi:transcriptional regulator with XRE-family HTH domain